jgi:hypothetical protein
MSESRLGWVHYNHGEPGRRPPPPVETARTQARARWEASGRGRTASAGELVRAVLQERTKLSELQRKLLEVLDEEAGDELLAHVGILNVRKGVLVVETAEAAVLYSLRLRWEQRLLQVVQKRLPNLGIHAVRFALAKRRGTQGSER